MNDTLLPNKMTKSYLLESDPYLMTSSKSSPFARTADDNVFHNSTWNPSQHGISNELSDRPTVKPLTLHNVPSNVPPISFINGNSVRPVRSRHYSQQQTVTPTNKKLDSCVNLSGDHFAATSENHDNENETHQSSKNGFKLSSSSSAMAPKSHKVKVQSPTTNHHQPQQHTKAQQSQRQQSPQQPQSSSIRDYVTNNEYEPSIYSLYENTEQVIQHLAKRIEGVLRTAKESRRLICTELLVPHMLMSQIASDLIELADCEPFGLRGCLLFICIEDSQHSSAKHKSSSSDSHQGNSNQMTPLSSRLLGEFAIDRSVVPTFEVFLTLKRATPNWFESLENKLLGKEPIVLSELYLLHKKNLYQPSSPTL